MFNILYIDKLNWKKIRVIMMCFKYCLNVNYVCTLPSADMVDIIFKIQITIYWLNTDLLLHWSCAAWVGETCLMVLYILYI